MCTSNGGFSVVLSCTGVILASREHTRTRDHPRVDGVRVEEIVSSVSLLHSVEYSVTGILEFGSAMFVGFSGLLVRYRKSPCSEGLPSPNTWGF